MGNFFQDFASHFIKSGVNPTHSLTTMEQNKANAARRAGLDEATSRGQGLQEEQLAQRNKDLAAIMGFYGPAMSEMERLYGTPASAWGTGTAASMQAAEAAAAAGRVPMSEAFNSTMGRLTEPLQDYGSTMAAYRERMGIPTPGQAPPPPAPPNPLGPSAPPPGNPLRTREAQASKIYGGGRR